MTMTDSHGLTTEFADRPDWRELAACRGMDTDIFYPEGRGRPLRAREAEAKAICAGCPVAASCRAEADTYPERFGIWGNATETERGWAKR